MNNVSEWIGLGNDIIRDLNFQLVTSRWWSAAYKASAKKHRRRWKETLEKHYPLTLVAMRRADDAEQRTKKMVDVLKAISKERVNMLCPCCKTTHIIVDVALDKMEKK